MGQLNESFYAVFSVLRWKTLWLVLSITLAVCTGCDPEEKHRILTTFFDGVPPLYDINPTDPNFIDSSGSKTSLFWYTHKPREDCAICHGEEKERTFSSEITLTAEPPELCFGCHEELRNIEKRYVHGPVAVGECLVCHDPHRTQNKHILKRPVPEICYVCHEEEWTNTIADHELEKYKQCLDCHSGHDSDQRYLLKETWNKKDTSLETENTTSEEIDITLAEQELIEVVNYF